MKFDIQKEADNIMLARYAPAGVLINDKMEVLQFRGHTGLFLEHSPGRASFKLLDMARDGLGVEIRTAVRRSPVETGAPGKRQNIRITTGHESNTSNSK